ncbi:MAG: ATP-binding cassette domain-containing protein [Roseburia faecis]
MLVRKRKGNGYVRSCTCDETIPQGVANDDINLTIEDGRIGVLLGPNGAGKSTIIKCIMGFLKYQGQIQVNGLENKSIEAKKIMGYIPEIPSLYPNLTVDEHMEFIARAYKLKDYKAYKDALLERFDLTDKKKKFGDELSKGIRAETVHLLWTFAETTAGTV